MNQNHSKEVIAPSNDKDYYQHSRPEMQSFVPENARKILDVGCSNGNFGFALKKRNQAIVWGIEPVEKAYQEAILKLDKVFLGVFEPEKQLDNEKFDCICFNDVLEHIDYPQKVLLECKKYLTNEGVIVASIPNIRHFSAMKHILIDADFKYTDSGIFDSTHLRFFTKKSISRFFEENGYKIISLQGINSIKPNKKEYKQFKRLRLLFGKRIDDMEFLQFAVVAKPIRN